MSSPAAAPASDLVLPALPPIKTAALTPSTAPPPDEAETVTAVKEEEAEPTTPTAEESRLRAPTECPPAPRKPARTPVAVKRKSPSSPSARLVFFPVQRDLSDVFRSLPPKKRIRAG